MATRKIKGTKILKNGSRQIYVFIEKKTVGGRTERIYKTEITQLTKVKDISDRREEMRLELIDEQTKKNANANDLYFSEYFDKWLAEVCQPRLASRTFEDYSRYSKDFIVPFLKKHGDFPLKEISSVFIHDIFVWLKNKKKGWAIPKMKQILSSALNNAVRWNLLDYNPVARVKTEKPESQEMKILSPADTQKFLKCCGEAEYGLAVEISLLTGMRPGETAGLRWKDIDFAKKLLHVRQSVTRTAGGGFEFKEPKSKRSIRKIALSFNLIEKLRAHKRAQNELIEYRKKKNYKFENLDLVFCTRYGTPLSMNNLNKRDLKEILKAAKLSEDYSLYSLRHSIASLLLADGASVKDVQELLGHATPSFTMNRYIHSLPDSKKELTDRFSRIIDEEIKVPVTDIIETSEETIN